MPKRRGVDINISTHYTDNGKSCVNQADPLESAPLTFKRGGLAAVIVLLLALILAPTAHAADTILTGRIVQPTTSLGVANATISMSLNQAAVKVGSFGVSATPETCYTSVDGSVVGIPNPLVTPITNANAAAGALSGTYYVIITYIDSGSVHETLASPRQQVLVSGPNNQITISAPILRPALATGYRVYMGTAPGSETLQTTVASWTSVNVTAYSMGAAAPGSNNSVCAVVGNDTLIPFGTMYHTSMIDANGTLVAGFPQDWYLIGTTWDMANGFPIAPRNIQARFPTPILANPTSNAQQSVNSPLTVNGYALTAGSLILPDNATPAACSAGRGVVYEDSVSHQLMACQNGGSATALLSTSSLFSRSAPGTFLANTSDRLVIGFASLGDYANGSFNSSLVVDGFGYFSSNTNTSASVLGVGYDQGTGTMRLASGITPGGTYVPLAVLTNGNERTRWDTAGRLLHGVTSVNGSFESNALISLGGQYVVGANSVNTAVGGLTYDAGSGTMRLVSGVVGSGTPVPLAVVQYDDLAFTNKEVGRFIKTADLAGTARVFNLQLGQTTARDYHSPLVIERDQDNASYALALNASNTGSASTGFRASMPAGNLPDIYIGVTSSNFTLSNGISSDEAFIISGSGALAGIAIQANAGSIRLYSGSTLAAAFGAGGTPIFSSPLSPTNGGTGNNVNFASHGIPYAGIPSQLTSSTNFTWDGNVHDITGGLALLSTTRVNPAGGVGVLHEFYDVGTDAASILAVNYTGPTYKNLKISAAALTLNGNGTDVWTITSNGPQANTGFSINATAGATSLSLANTTFPGSIGGTPYTWFKMVASDGSIVYVPGYK